jgi:alanine racemase
MSRPTIAHIQLDAFRYNYRVAKQLHGGKALAVIKANAYGHGALACAQSIQDEADAFAVASLEEALQLRQAGLKNPILLLEGFFDATELAEIVANDLWIVIHAEWQLAILLATKLAKPVHVWLKLDSGMHRIGFQAQSYQQAYITLAEHANVASIVHMTHFANADVLGSTHTNQQISLFEQTVENLPAQEISFANSAAVLSWPQSYRNWSRPGIMLYGANPVIGNSVKLRPVMKLSSTLISIRTIQAGESVGYGGIFTANQATTVGVVACGYADGYPRATLGAPVLVAGHQTKLIGRVSMDMLCVDLTEIPNAQIGSPVELWGDTVEANEVAKCAGTIAYELFCNVKRVSFKYSDSERL